LRGLFAVQTPEQGHFAKLQEEVRKEDLRLSHFSLPHSLGDFFMADGRWNLEDIRKALDEFQDPETGRGIVRLGQVHDLHLEDGRLSITLGLTTYAAPIWQETRADLIEFVHSRIPQLAEVQVELVVHDRPAEKIGEIGLTAKSVIAVGSGKGGVGKSTIAATIAYGLARAGSKVGLMDADVYGPSIPHLLGANQRPTLSRNRIQPVMVDGLAVMSMGFLVPAGEAVIWRGPMLHGAITQFLRDTEWGDLDYLIIDMPPGTGDIALTLSQLLPLSGAVVVCTPQDVALLDATKAIAMFRKVNIDVLGMVENMSHFVCTHCGTRHDIFGSGGAKQRAGDLDVPFLGEVPLNTHLRVLGDEGKVGASFDDPVSAPYLNAICTNLVRNLVARHRQRPVMPSLTVL
jgi:ATP-binding protein involved in chromosome partitioning